MSEFGKKSNTTTICPTCGAEVIDVGRCSVCGVPLHAEDRLVAAELSDNKDNQFTPEPDSILESSSDTTSTVTAPSPEFGIVIDAIERHSLVLLLSRSELEVLESELNQLIEQIEATRYALRLKHADKAVLTRRVEDLKAHLHKITTRINELKSFTGQLEIESIIHKIESIHTKIQTIEDRKRSIEPSIYREQITDLESELYRLEDSLRATIRRTEGWLKAIQKKIQVLQHDMKLLDAKYNDITREAYESLKFKAERSIHILSGGYRILDDLLARAKKLL